MLIKYFIVLCIFGISQGKISFAPCRSCVPIEECPFVRNLSAEEQRVWMARYHCDTVTIGTTRIYEGFSSIAKGDQILCCPHTNQPIPTENETIDKPRVERKASTKYNPAVINVRNVPEQSHRRTRQVDNGSNPFFLKKPANPTQTNPPNDMGLNDPSRDTKAQCNVHSLASAPPDPESGCCGRDTSDTDRITDLESILPTHAPLVANKWEQYFLPKSPGPTDRKIKGSTRNKTDVVDLEPKISGGNETELEQYPWTVLMRILFNFGNEVEEFTCGGSLISSTYVLTAAHCVREENAELVKLDITLAEYDKRTFPNDCIAVGEGRMCIQNIVIPAQEVTVHPSYEETWLHNDIALVRLRSPAPYTNVIRPICLAPLNIDTPKLTNLPLAVSGWGQNRQFYTSVKQSTVLNLIPKEECERSYPNISKDHICAVGSTGEDTCRGDSGGPLMVLFRGRYYLMGVVSGKRADSPCGTSVPSLFTNVFNYIDWIQGVIRRNSN